MIVCFEEFFIEEKSIFSRSFRVGLGSTAVPVQNETHQVQNSTHWRYEKSTHPNSPLRFFWLAQKFPSFFIFPISDFTVTTINYFFSYAHMFCRVFGRATQHIFSQYSENVRRKSCDFYLSSGEKYVFGIKFMFFCHQISLMYEKFSLTLCSTYFPLPRSCYLLNSVKSWQQCNICVLTISRRRWKIS